MHESKMHDENSFLTLTYDNEHFPQGCVECAPGVKGSLCVCELQRFVKRLRARVAPKRIRVFACGEYGEKLGRPHYHLIVFGFGFPDRVFLSGTGDMSLYTSPLLSATWGLGFASLGQVSFDSAAYVANYATKKISGPPAADHYQGRKPEFLVMSRRPGIGRGWIDVYSSDVYPSDEVIVRGRQCRPPRYYDQVALRLCDQSTADLLARREADASALEAFELPDGSRVDVAPGRNARRLVVREKVARAKFALKRRSMEGNSNA